MGTNAIDIVDVAMDQQRRRELADRFAAVGMVTAGVVHDLNNPLSAVLSSIAAASRALQRNDLATVAATLAAAEERAQKMATLIGFLKSALHPCEAKAVEIADVLAAAAGLAEPQIRACAGGCSAEQGSGNEGPSVGETRSRLELAALSAARKEALSCVIHSASDSLDKLFVYGGKDAAGYLNTTYLYNPVDDTWTAKDTTWDETDGSPTNQTMPSLSGAQMISIPGTDKCWLVGGNDGTNTVATGYIYDLSDNAWTKSSTNAYDMGSARKNFVVSFCGNSNGTQKIIALGGIDNGGTYPTAIDVFDGTTRTAFAGSLSQGRQNLSVAALLADNSVANGYTKFIVAGGDQGGTAKTRIDALTANDSCGAGTGNNAGSLSTARFRAVAFQTGNANEFYVAKGTTTDADALADSEKVTATWSGATTTVAVVAGTTCGTTGRRAAKVIKYSPTKWAIVGGIADTNPDAPVKDVNIWDTSSLSCRTGIYDMINARADFVGEYLPSEERVFVAGGSQTSSLTAISAAETL